MSNIFRGLGVALITPFKSDMSIDFEALERLVNYQLDNGADFLCILATTGETPCLTRSEKDEITRVVKSVVKGRVPLLKYCGGNNTRAVIEEMKSSLRAQLEHTSIKEPDGTIHKVSKKN